MGMLRVFRTWALPFELGGNVVSFKVWVQGSGLRLKAIGLSCGFRLQTGTSNEFRG